MLLPNTKTLINLTLNYIDPDGETTKLGITATYTAGDENHNDVKQQVVVKTPKRCCGFFLNPKCKVYSSPGKQALKLNGQELKPNDPRINSIDTEGYYEGVTKPPERRNSVSFDKQ